MGKMGKCSAIVSGSIGAVQAENLSRIWYRRLNMHLGL